MVLKKVLGKKGIQQLHHTQRGECGTKYIMFIVAASIILSRGIYVVLKDASFQFESTF